VLVEFYSAADPRFTDANGLGRQALLCVRSKVSNNTRRPPSRGGAIGRSFNSVKQSQRGDDARDCFDACNGPAFLQGVAKSSAAGACSQI